MVKISAISLIIQIKSRKYAMNFPMAITLYVAAA